MSHRSSAWGFFALILLLTAVSSGSALENPFAKANVGDWVSYEMTLTIDGKPTRITTKQFIKAKTEKEVTLVSEGKFGEQPFTEERKIPLDKPFDLAQLGRQTEGAVIEKLEEGKETFTIGGKQYPCTRTKYKVRVKQPVPLETINTFWVSPDVPLHGMVKMETVLPGHQLVMTMTGHGKGK